MKVNVLAYRFLNSVSVLALGVAFFLAPALLDTTSLLAIDSALAKQGGKGNGKGSSSGNGSANGTGASKIEKPSSTKAEKTEKAPKTSKVVNSNLASKFGALNAANASAKAFANASPSSRIGKIKAYYAANQAALSARATADETDAVAKRGAFESSGIPSVVAAYEALQTDPTNSSLQDAYNQVVTDAGLTGEQIAAVETTFADWQNAVEADNLAANAVAQAEAALDVAANKTPVSLETRTALDALLAGKIN